MAKKRDISKSTAIYCQCGLMLLKTTDEDELLKRFSKHLLAGHIVNKQKTPLLVSKDV